MKKGIFLLLLSLQFLAILSPGFTLAQEKALEVVYPEIPGIPTPKTIGVALPDYVNYIFRFAVVIIGFIIFGTLIYSGFIYLTSSGNPTRLSEARSRILAGLLGAGILLGSYLIFTTINPRLVQLELKSLDPAKPVVLQGIYVCTKKVPSQDDLSGNIERYKTGDATTTIAAAQKIGDIMVKYNCKRMSASGPLESTVTKTGNTFFSIPEIKIARDPKTGRETSQSLYDYGLVLHETDRRSGKCKLVTETGASPYAEVKADSGPDFNFRARSFTLFQKLRPDQKPASEAQGAILYSCLNYNEGGACAIGQATTTAISTPFQLGGAEMRKASPLGNLSENARSIQFDPTIRTFAVLYEDSGFGQNGKCEVVRANDRNLLDNNIGRCGVSCWFIRAETEERQLLNCKPCMKSMIVIEGIIQ